MNRSNFIKNKPRPKAIEIDKQQIKKCLLKEFNFENAVIVLDAIGWKHFNYTKTTLAYEADSLIDSFFKELEDDPKTDFMGTGCFEVVRHMEDYEDGTYSYELRFTALDAVAYQEKQNE